MAQPALQVCPICALDDDVAIQKVDDEWVMTCASAEHPPFEWRPASQYQKTISYRTGIGEELGVYDTLLECLLPGLSEYGVIEYRFSQADPSTYRHLLDRYGHTALAPSKYTTSSFLGGALGALARRRSDRHLGSSNWLLVLQPDRRHLRTRRHPSRRTDPQLGHLRCRHLGRRSRHLAPRGRSPVIPVAATSSVIGWLSPLTRTVRTAPSST
ncbi:MAG: hypothetical protein R2701_00475 [Acidimicrobiales bacterium]